MVLLSPIPIRTEKILPINLPVVDLSTERSMLTKLIVKACEEYGFFNVINHGVPCETVAKMEEAAFDFFARPLPQKKQLPIYGCKNIGFNGDMGEIEYLLLNASPPSIAHFNNISNVPSNFSCSVSAYRDGVRELACEILELMAEGLGVPDRRFLSRLIRDVDSDSVLRFNHYPPTLNKNCKDKDMSPSHTHTNVGFGEHSDPQILTILRSNDVAGLQISLQDGVWNPVPPDPSAFCVNVGDLLQVMTNGRFVSVRHRAVTNSHKSRMSVAYFGGPPLDACIVAPSVMVTPQRPSLFKPFTWAEYKKVTYSMRLGERRIDLFRNCTQLHTQNYSS
ncbi:gibberellin 2-beta-dioxygenase 2-like [Vigna umbellata]|uniref:gibberellin 2-beta-dioxygenase 2-like n=1 Tax=Vigna umbellata TaxID=87088 RepID=UPI001F5FE4CF|nr:gibberellin 2-beta-dioxygenase 2-like [Vigna umbellata]